MKSMRGEEEQEQHKSDQIYMKRVKEIRERDIKNIWFTVLIILNSGSGPEAAQIKKKSAYECSALKQEYASI